MHCFLLLAGTTLCLPLTKRKVHWLSQYPFCQLMKPRDMAQTSFVIDKAHVLHWNPFLSIDKALVHLPQSSFLIDKASQKLPWALPCQLTKPSTPGPNQ